MWQAVFTICRCISYLAQSISRALLVYWSFGISAHWPWPLSSSSRSPRFSHSHCFASAACAKCQRNLQGLQSLDQPNGTRFDLHTLSNTAPNQSSPTPQFCIALSQVYQTPRGVPPQTCYTLGSRDPVVPKLDSQIQKEHLSQLGGSLAVLDCLHPKFLWKKVDLWGYPCWDTRGGRRARFQGYSKYGKTINMIGVSKMLWRGQSCW